MAVAAATAVITVGHGHGHGHVYGHVSSTGIIPITPGQASD